MIKVVEFPNKVFSTKEDLHRALKLNEKDLINLKTSQVYKSSEKGQISFNNAEKLDNCIGKSNFSTSNENIYPVISTTNYMDGHKDVHFDGCFTKTVKEQQGKVKYVLDHELKWDSIIAWEKDVKMIVSHIDWSYVGKSYNGKTQGLIFVIPKNAIKRKDVLEEIENRSSNFENSIRMVYVKVFLGLDSDRKEDKENKAYYDAKINLIANKEEVIKEGYFWGVEELGIYKEGSLVVAGGSNDATSIYMENKNIEPLENTQIIEPSKDTQQEKKNYFINISKQN